MFKILTGILIGAVIVFGYFYMNPKTYDITVSNNSGEVITQLDLVYTNTLCPLSCTLTLKNLLPGQRSTLSIQNPDTGHYVINASFSGLPPVQSKERQIMSSGHQTEVITTISIDSRY